MRRQNRRVAAQVVAEELVEVTSYPLASRTALDLRITRVILMT